MTTPWRPFFDLYWKNRPGAPFSHNPQKVFEAGFLAGVKQAPDLSLGAVTVQTEYGVQYSLEPGDPMPVWIAEDIDEERGEAIAHDERLSND